MIKCVENRMLADDVKLDFSDVLIVPKKSQVKSRSDVLLEVNYSFKYATVPFTGVPILASNMDTVGTFQMAVALSSFKIHTVVSKHYSLEEWIEFSQSHRDCLQYVSVSTGIHEQDFSLMKQILDSVPQVKSICIDVANGYMEDLLMFTYKVRMLYPSYIIMVGNVVTREGVIDLLNSGADVVKVGIGSGSVCTTRIKTGIGYPQFSAVMECAAAARENGGHIISDGGCVCSGDMAKAFGAGASFVMVGGMLAGYDECGCSVETSENGSQTVLYYGMSSKTAMKRYPTGNLSKYRASEGRTVRIKYRGSIVPAIQDVLHGIQSACSYVGAECLPDLSREASFIRVARQYNNVYAPFTIGN